MNIIERLKKVIESQKTSVRAFASHHGLKQQTLSNQLNGTRELSLTTILAVLTANEEISAEWLMRGEGTMFKDTTPLEVMEAKANEALAKVVSSYQEMLDVKNERIAKLEEENRQLKAQVK